jgi:hypothetical protein
MKPFFEKVDSCWKTNGFVSWMLVSAGMVLAVWQVIDHTHPGVSIGLLAAVAGIMTVRPLDKFPVEKFIWVLLLVAFTVLEILAIGKSDAENIAKNREILAGMTGGDSYLSIQPQALPDSESTDSFPLMAFTVGSHTIWDAMLQVSEGRTTAENAFDSSKRKMFQMRAYSNTWSQTLDVAPFILIGARTTSTRLRFGPGTLPLLKSCTCVSILIRTGGKCPTKYGEHCQRRKLASSRFQTSIGIRCRNLLQSHSEVGLMGNDG